MTQDAHKNLMINNQWHSGEGDNFSSINPANGEAIWQGNAATEEQVAQAIKAAQRQAGTGVKNRWKSVLRSLRTLSSS